MRFKPHSGSVVLRIILSQEIFESSSIHAPIQELNLASSNKVQMITVDFTFLCSLGVFKYGFHGCEVGLKLTFISVSVWKLVYSYKITFLFFIR